MDENEPTEFLSEDERRERQEVDAWIDEYERTHPLDSPEQQAIDAEDLRMPERFPSELVTYHDHWDGTNLTRTILAHAADWKALREQLAAYPDELLQDSSTMYVDPPNQALCTRLWTHPPRPHGDGRQE